MPRYYFHRLDGGFDADTEGSELKDARDARLHAIIYAAALRRIIPRWFGRAERCASK